MSPNKKYGASEGTAVTDFRRRSAMRKNDQPVGIKDARNSQPRTDRRDVTDRVNSCHNNFHLEMHYGR